MQLAADRRAVHAAAPAVLGIAGTVPEDVLHRLLGQPAKALPIVRLPKPGLVPDDHVADQHGLEGLPHALGRQLAGHTPRKADIDLGDLLEVGPVPPDPLQIVHLQGLRHQGESITTVSPGRPCRPVPVHKAPPGRWPRRLLQLLVLLRLLLHRLLRQQLLGSRQLCKQPLEAE